MEKGIIILDIPKCCNNCPCYDGMDGRSECNVLEKEIESCMTVDENCPIVKLPCKVSLNVCKKTDEVYKENFKEENYIIENYYLTATLEKYK